MVSGSVAGRGTLFLCRHGDRQLVEVLDGLGYLLWTDVVDGVAGGLERRKHNFLKPCSVKCEFHQRVGHQLKCKQCSVHMIGLPKDGNRKRSTSGSYCMMFMLI